MHKCLDVANTITFKHDAQHIHQTAVAPLVEVLLFRLELAEFV